MTSSGPIFEVGRFGGNRDASIRNRPTADEKRAQLSEQRRRVDFDTYDVTVDELLRRVHLE
jgi:hypothetical protein